MFSSLISQNCLFRVALVSTLCITLLLPRSPLFTTEAASSQSAARTARPQPGKPEGVFPDLTEVKKELDITREPESPIPSTVRSPKNPLRPWNGRRVGDPEMQGSLDQGSGYHQGVVVPSQK